VARERAYRHERELARRMYGQLVGALAELGHVGAPKDAATARAAAAGRVEPRAAKCSGGAGRLVAVIVGACVARALAPRGSPE
jgi:hypothetical protein